MFNIYFRYDINSNGDYTSFNNCTDASTIASLFKLFLRELPQPLISNEVITDLASFDLNQGCEAVNIRLKNAFNLMDNLPYRVLRYILVHLKKVAAVEANMMGVRSLGIVFSPNLIQPGADKGKTPNAIMDELERNNKLVETIIEHVNDIFNH